MNAHSNRKKKLIVSYKKLSEELLELFNETYPDNSYRDHLQKNIKPNGEPIFVVPLETEDTSYMVKFDVKIDTALVDDDFDKNLYGDTDTDDEGGDDGEFAPISDTIDKEENPDGNHIERVIRYGSYDDLAEEGSSKKHLSPIDEATKTEIQQAFGVDDTDFAPYSDEQDDEQDDDEDGDPDLAGDEPSDADIADIDADFAALVSEVEAKPKTKKTARTAKTAKTTTTKKTAAASATKKPSTKKTATSAAKPSKNAAPKAKKS